MPKLSVIVPVYNVEDYLPACIDSILGQTLEDLELILIDDGSPDGCGAICDAYARRDTRVRVIHQSNQGVSAARNAGLRMAEGEYIGFVDPDDWVSADAFELLCRAAADSESDLAICGFTFCAEDGTEESVQAVPSGVFSREELILSIYGMPNQFHGSMCNKIFSRRVLEGLRFDETVAIGEDWLLLYECYCRCAKAAAVPDCCYFVRNRAGSATRKTTAELYVKKLQAYLRLYEAAKAHSRRVQRQAAAKILDTCIMNKLEIGKHPENRKSMKFVNRQLRLLSRQAFLRGNLPLKKTVYYYREGLRS